VLRCLNLSSKALILSFRYICRRRKKPHLDRHLVGQTGEAHPRGSSPMPPTSYRTVPGWTTAAQLLGFPLLVAHAGFQGNGGDGLVGRRECTIRPSGGGSAPRGNFRPASSVCAPDPPALHRLQPKSAVARRGARAWPHLLYVLFGFFGASPVLALAPLTSTSL